MDTTKVKLTKAQREALKAYQFAERQEDRYLGSVFATTPGKRVYEEKTRAAYEACKRLGMGVEHGHLNVLTPDHQSVVTAHGKHDRVVCCLPKGDEMYMRVDLKWGLGMPTPAQMLTVARKIQGVAGRWGIERMERYQGHNGECVDVYFKRA